MNEATETTTTSTTTALDAVPEVKLYDEDTYKFIVCHVHEGENAKKMVVRAASHDRCEYHDDILQVLRKEVRTGGMTARCIGGGRLRYDAKKKTIEIWDSSGAFGRERDRGQTLQILQRAYPDFQVTEW